MKKVKIYSERSKKKIYDILRKSAFVSARYTDRNTVYVPLGELYGVKILIKHKIKQKGEYLILE